MKWGASPNALQSPDAVLLSDQDPHTQLLASGGAARGMQYKAAAVKHVAALRSDPASPTSLIAYVSQVAMASSRPRLGRAQRR